jgi:hypothetical protein
MASQINSTQHCHGVVTHQGINAQQGEVLLNSLSDQQTIKRVFVRHRQLIQTTDVRPLHRQQQPTFLIDNPPMNLWQRQIEIQLAQLHLDLDLPEVDHAAENPIFGVSDAACGCGGKAGWFRQPPNQHARIKKEPGAAQGIRNSSAMGASKSAWVRILPSRPPGWRGDDAACVAESSSAASRAPTWMRSSGDRRSSWCCRDGLMEVMAKSASAEVNPRWVERSFPPPADTTTSKSRNWPAGAMPPNTTPLVTREELR